jgi:hypothetical protein
MAGAIHSRDYGIILPTTGERQPRTPHRRRRGRDLYSGLAEDISARLPTHIEAVAHHTCIGHSIPHEPALLCSSVLCPPYGGGVGREEKSAKQDDNPHAHSRPFYLTKSDTAGEVIFAGSSTLTHRVFENLPNVNHAYLRLRQQFAIRLWRTTANENGYTMPAESGQHLRSG